MAVLTVGFTGSSYDPVTNSLNIAYSFNNTGPNDTTWELIAIPSGGGSPISVASTSVTLPTGVDSGTINVDLDTNPAPGGLPPGTYQFGVTLTQSDGGFPFGPGPTNVGATGDVVICFLAGTMIATPDGEVAVEALRPDDLVLTADGRAVPVLWLGRQAIMTRFGLSEARHPVLIRAGALGENLPRRDLRVTADHAMLIDGVLVQAGALVNGSSIRRMDRAELDDVFTVYHIETADHEIVLAEGAATETFIDNLARARFDNYAEFVALYGAEGRPMAELDQPRAVSARQVPPAIRAKIAARAAASAPDAAVAA